MGVPRPTYEKIIATPNDVKPSFPDTEVVGIFNPGGTYIEEGINSGVYLLARVLERTTLNFEGHIATPYAVKSEDGKYKIRWSWERKGIDAKRNDACSLVTLGPEERTKPCMISHFRLMTSKNGLEFKISEEPTFYPRESYEEFGIEDPRVTRFSEPVEIGGKKFRNLISYVACSEETDVCTAFAATNDFKKFTRLPEKKPGIVFFAPSKDIVLFPKKFVNPRTGREEFASSPRPSSPIEYMIPSIFISYSNDLFQWGDHVLFVRGDEEGHVGMGPPPIEVEEGFLIVYHQHRHFNGTKEYIGTAILVDKKNPAKILRKSEAFLKPHMKTGIKPIVQNVTFPSAAFLKGDDVFIYTGENDSAIALHIYKLEDLMDVMRRV